MTMTKFDVLKLLYVLVITLLTLSLVQFLFGVA